MSPEIGQVVLYKLSDWDAQAINRRRVDAHAYQLQANKTQMDFGASDPGGLGREGFMAHTGNAAAPGVVYPAIVVADFGGTTRNLQVLLDGSDTYWATSRQEGDQPGYWAWPKRVAE